MQSYDASWSWTENLSISRRVRNREGRSVASWSRMERSSNLALQPEKEYSWSAAAPDGSPLTPRALKIKEIYAVDLKLPYPLKKVDAYRD